MDGRKFNMVMTQEERTLLLKDLCSRLPYGVKVVYLASTYDVEYINSKFDEIKLGNLDYTIAVGSVKPYLRPISSMTDEEKKEYHKVIVKSQDCSFENNESAAMMVSDWLLSKGFDVHGLIPKGLALEAPEGTYKTE